MNEFADKFLLKIRNCFNVYFAIIHMFSLIRFLYISRLHFHVMYYLTIFKFQFLFIFRKYIDKIVVFLFCFFNSCICACVCGYSRIVFLHFLSEFHICSFLYNMLCPFLYNLNYMLLFLNILLSSVFNSIFLMN